VSSLYEAPYQLVLKRIRAARRAADVTQAELASRLGTDQSFISKYERGERRLDVVELRAICLALGISLIDFLRDIEVELRKRELE
jgi:transcriptional regulator with XRE-family HTH domain